MFWCSEQEINLRALGDANFKEGADALVSNRPDVRHLTLTPADSSIIIATDGLFDVVADQDAAAVVTSHSAEEVNRVWLPFLQSSRAYYHKRCG